MEKFEILAAHYIMCKGESVIGTLKELADCFNNVDSLFIYKTIKTSVSWKN